MTRRRRYALVLTTLTLAFACVLLNLPTLRAEGIVESESAANTLLSAYKEAAAAHEPVQNLLHLYLRIAGVFWVCAEWAAAIVLWRVYRALARRSRMLGFRL